MTGIEGISGPGQSQRHLRAGSAPAEGFSKHLDGTKPAAAPGVRISRPLSGDVVRAFSPSHAGVDIAAPAGSPVKAALEGIVESAGWAGDRGNLMVVRSGNQRAYYGHLQEFAVSPGDAIKAGQQIAVSGATGATAQPALHFELHSKGASVDPTPLLAQS